jgi:tetratricopeptide (TPR) repeat protein
LSELIKKQSAYSDRSYLRCLYGYGECLYRLQETEDARKVFEKLLWLNPDDHQGVRALIAAIDAATSWSDLKKEEY